MQKSFLRLVVLLSVLLILVLVGANNIGSNFLAAFSTAVNQSEPATTSQTTTQTPTYTSSQTNSPPTTTNATENPTTTSVPTTTPTTNPSPTSTATSPTTTAPTATPTPAPAQNLTTTPSRTQNTQNPTTAVPPPSSCVNVAPIDYMKLAPGGRSPENKKLQQFLNNHDFFVNILGSTGSFGYESDYFGSATKLATIQYQKSIGIKLPLNSPLWGKIGPLTVQKMNRTISSEKCSNNNCEDMCEQSPPITNDSLKNNFLADISGIFSPPPPDPFKICTKNPPVLPDGCKILKGADVSVKSLYCMATIQDPNVIRTKCVSTTTSQCQLSDSTLEDIAKQCTNLKIVPGQDETVEKLDCVLDKIHDGLGGDKSNVCRHYSTCTRLAFKLMGIPVQSMGVGFPGVGHAFNIVPSQTGNYYIDSFWGVKLWCPTNSPIEPGVPDPIQTFSHNECVYDGSGFDRNGKCALVPGSGDNRCLSDEGCQRHLGCAKGNDHIGGENAGTCLWSPGRYDNQDGCLSAYNYCRYSE